MADLVSEVSGLSGEVRGCCVSKPLLVKLTHTATVWSTCNWAVGSFVFGSFMMYEFCQRRRQLEMQGMKRAVEVIDRKQAEKQKKAEEVRAARRKAKEEA